MITKEQYDLWKSLRWGDGENPEAAWGRPQVASGVIHRWRRAVRPVSGPKMGKLSWNDKIKPYGGWSCEIEPDPALAAEIKAAGWEQGPEGLTFRVTLANDDWHESLMDQAHNQGFIMTRWSDDYDRPDHTSVKVDLSGPRDRPDRWWITTPEDWFKFEDMAAGPRRHLIDHRRREVAQAWANWARKVLRDEVQSFVVMVDAFWQGKEVGGDSVGGAEMETGWQGPPKEEVVSFIVDYDLLFEAWAGALRWREGAVEALQERAARLVEEAANLPPAAKDSTPAAQAAR